VINFSLNMKHFMIPNIDTEYISRNLNAFTTEMNSI